MGNGVRRETLKRNKSICHGLIHTFTQDVVFRAIIMVQTPQMNLNENNSKRKKIRLLPRKVWTYSLEKVNVPKLLKNWLCRSWKKCSYDKVDSKNVLKRLAGIVYQTRLLPGVFDVVRHHLVTTLNILTNRKRSCIRATISPIPPIHRMLEKSWILIAKLHDKSYIYIQNHLFLSLAWDFVMHSKLQSLIVYRGNEDWRC